MTRHMTRHGVSQVATPERTVERIGERADGENEVTRKRATGQSRPSPLVPSPPAPSTVDSATDNVDSER